MNMGNGSTLKIEEQHTSSNVTFNQFIPFISQLTAENGIVEHVYMARLYASGPVIIGDTEKVSFCILIITDRCLTFTTKF
ncbi:MAG: hypothetical protein ACSLEN_07985 [Candidatus Malihini olakiniferum]